MSSFAIASGKLNASTSSEAGFRAQRLDELRGRLPSAHACLAAALGEAPRSSSLRPQPLRDRAGGKPAQLTQRAQAEPFELRVTIRRHRQERERQRLEELLFLLRRNEEDLARPRDARRGEGGEAPVGGADARVPGRADGGERTLERRLHASVETLDTLRLEDDRALLDRIDGEAGVLEAPQDALPLPLDGRGIAIDEDK